MEFVKTLYLYVAEKYGIEKTLGDNISYYKIEEEEFKFETGSSLLELEDVIKKHDLRKVYGFCVDTKHIEGIDKEFAALGIKADLIPNVLDDTSELSEMIVLHELAHLIEKLSLSNSLKLEYNDCDKTLAEKIVLQLDKYGGDSLNHNLLFVQVLNGLIRRVHKENSSHFMRLAMSKTLIDIEQAIKDNEINESYYACN